MKLNKKKVLVLALAVCLIATLSIGTLAWFSAEDEIKNDFLFATDDEGKPDFSVDVTEEGGKLSGYTDAEVWTVSENGDGTVTFSTAAGKKLSMGEYSILS